MSSNYNRLASLKPTLYNRALADKIIEAIKMGASMDAAAGYVGLHRQTLMKWMQHAREQRRDGPISYEDLQYLFDGITNARGHRQVRWLAQIETAAQLGDWRAAAWKLERIHPEHFAKQETVTVQAAVPAVQLPEANYIEALMSLTELPDIIEGEYQEVKDVDDSG